jgi:O-antigen/teichoic acid export membrane protein
MPTKRILKNFLSLSTGEIIGKLLAFVRVIFLARLLGAELFGTLEFASTILLYFVLFIDVGLGALGTREIARNADNVKKYVSNILTIKLIISFFAYFLIFIIAAFIPKSLETRNALLIYGLILFPSSLSTIWVFLGLERMKIVALVTVIFHLCLTVFIVMSVRDGDDVLRVPFIQFVCDIIITIILMTVYVRQFGIIKLQINLPFWKKLIGQSLPIGLSQIFGTINFNLDVIMIGFLMEEKFVGWYCAGFKIIVFLVTFIISYQLALYPVISKLYKSSVAETRNLISNSLRFCAIFGIPIAFGGVMLAKQIINMAYGGQYTNAIIPLQIMIWTIPIVLLRSIFKTTLVGLNEQMAGLKVIGSGALINIILNIILIRKYGMIGAAVATVCAEVVILCLGYYYVKNLIVHIPLFKHIVKPIFSSTIMLLCLIFMSRLNILLTLPVGIFIYFLVLALSRGVSSKDFKRFFKGA